MRIKTFTVPATRSSKYTFGVGIAAHRLYLLALMVQWRGTTYGVGVPRGVAR